MTSLETLVDLLERPTPGGKKTFTFTKDDITLPATLITGIRPGKTVLLTAGVHGCEYCSIQAAVELAEELRPEEMNGRVLVLPVANVSGFRDRLPAVVAEDGKNLNRVFPGDASGSKAERLAHCITTLQLRSDFYVDMHGGDLHEAMFPFVFFPGVGEPEVTEASRQAARALNVGVRVRSSATSGAYNSAALRGVPSLLVERGGLGRWSREEVNAYKDDIRRILAHLGVTEGPDGGAGDLQRETVPVYLEAQEEGCWYPAVSPGQNVNRHAVLGELRDMFGRRRHVYHAERSGTVLYMTVSLAVGAGTPLVAYG